MKECLSNIEDVCKGLQFSPENIWNIHEAGVTTVHKPTIIVAQKGKKQVRQTTSHERITLITAYKKVNALGNNIPPFLIFKNSNVKDHMYRGSPAGNYNSWSSKIQWMDTQWTADNFIEFFRAFQKHTKCLLENNVLLIMDIYGTHIIMK